MPTFKELVDEVTLSLQGFTLRQDRSTHLTQDITTTQTTMTLASADNVAKGMIQVDDELIWVDSYDKNTGILTIPPYGRGYLGTKKTSHKAGSQVLIKPTFPRHNIKKSINDTVKAVGDTIFATGTYVFTYNPSQVSYSLPNDVDNILGLSWKNIGPSQEWIPIRGWRIDQMANISSFNSTKSLSIYEPIVPGREVQVFYSKEPDTFELDQDDYEFTTGLPLSAKDVIVYGAAYRLTSMVDPGRLTFVSPESEIQTDRIRVGQAQNAALYLFTLYQQRLNEESRKQRDRYPIRVHYTR